MPKSTNITTKPVKVDNKTYITDLEEPAPDGIDLLDIDKPIRGQKFCCLSFIEPQLKDLEKFEAYLMTGFMQKFLLDYTKKIINKVSSDYNLDYNELINKYQLVKNVDDDSKNFTDEKWNEIKKIHEEGVKNHFFSGDIYDMISKYHKYRDINITNLRKNYKNEYPDTPTRSGVKFRGAFSTYAKARKYANELFKKDKVVNIFAVQSGAWVPFNPSEDEVKNQKTSEKKLNNLMWQYRKNQMYAEHFFNQRKEEMIKNRMRRKINKKQKTNNTKTINDNTNTNNNINNNAELEGLLKLDDTSEKEIDDIVTKLKNDKKD